MAAEEDWRQELRAGASALGLSLPGSALALFERYAAELLRWRARLNLTGFRTAEAICREGFLDSLGCVLALPPGPLRAIDIGSGAGFPGLPLRIVREDLSLTLVEANRRRHSFLAHVSRTLGLSDVECRRARAEGLASLPGFAGAFDVAFARAVGTIQVAAALTQPFLRPAGIFVAQQAGGEASRPPALAGFRPPSPAALPPVVRGRALVVYQRNAESCFT